MSIIWPTKDQAYASILTLYRALRPDADYTKGSDLWLNSKTWAVLVTRANQTVKQALDAHFYDTAIGSYLGSLLNLFGLPDGQGNFGFILPHISSADAGFTIETVAGMAANLTLNQTLTDAAGKTYIITEQNGIIAAGDTEDVDIESVDTGFEVNLESGTVLTWVAAPAGADATGTLAKDLRGGTALETDSGGQARLLDRTRRPPMSGNVSSWRSTIEAVLPGNLKAWVWPQRQNQPYGWNTTDFCATYITESGTDRHIAAADDIYTDIDNAVSAAMPALSYRNSRQLTLTTAATPVELTLTLGPSATNEQKADWDAVSANPTGAAQTTVASNDAGGNTIVTTGSSTYPTLTYGLKAGDRFVVNGVESTCAAVTNATTFEVIPWPIGFGTVLNNLAGFNITAGGGFIGQKTDYDNSVVGSGCVEAIRVYMDDRGPNDSYNGATSEIPGWASDVKVQQLESACFVVGGGIIEAAAVTLPAGDLSHTSQDVATATIYDVSEITIWQVYS